MVKHEIKVRVRYAETDQMRYVYYGNYAQYFEMGRTELIRSLGLSYRNMEEEWGILLPVRDLRINYLKPAFYDDELTIVSAIRKIPGASIEIDHEIYNPENIIITTGTVTLVFFSLQTKRPVKAPPDFLSALYSHWKYDL
ncbi:MAG: acyl-CoA thioesterase [Sphingobacteriia bacterium]|nr:acyl-CoA thioesterase [Sphingobacteriia bacterium]